MIVWLFGNGNFYIFLGGEKKDIRFKRVLGKCLEDVSKLVF